MDTLIERDGIKEKYACLLKMQEQFSLQYILLGACNLNELSKLNRKLMSSYKINFKKLTA